MKRRLLIFIMILLISVLLAYWNEPCETIVEQVLYNMYSYEYNSYVRVDGYRDILEVDRKKRNKVRKYFTDDGFEMLGLNRVMSKMLGAVTAYRLSSSIDSMEISIRDSEDPNVRTAFYDIVLKLEPAEEDTEPLFFDISGSMTLRKGYKWEIDYLPYDRLFYQSLEKKLWELYSK